MTTYDRWLEIIIREKERKKITFKALAELVGCRANTMSGYLYLGVRMPADIMFSLLQALGYRLRVEKVVYEK